MNEISREFRMLWLAENKALEIQNGRNIALGMAEFERRIVGMRKYLQKFEFEIHSNDCWLDGFLSGKVSSFLGDCLDS